MKGNHSRNYAYLWPAAKARILCVAFGTAREEFVQSLHAVQRGIGILCYYIPVNRSYRDSSLAFAWPRRLHFVQQVLSVLHLLLLAGR